MLLIFVLNHIIPECFIKDFVSFLVSTLLLSFSLYCRDAYNRGNIQRHTIIVMMPVIILRAITATNRYVLVVYLYIIMLVPSISIPNNPMLIVLNCLFQKWA